MSTLLHNGLRVIADEETGRILTVKSLDGGFHFFHVCCGCHKVHEAHFYVKDEGNTLVSEWELPLPDESTKIVAGLPPALEKDLIVYERSNFHAAEEIATLRSDRDALAAGCEAAMRIVNEALPKFNWGASALDANAIQVLNEMPAIIRAALARVGR